MSAWLRSLGKELLTVRTSRPSTRARKQHTSKLLEKLRAITLVWMMARVSRKLAQAAITRLGRLFRRPEEFVRRL
jgi:hypothetical protein